MASDVGNLLGSGVVSTPVRSGTARSVSLESHPVVAETIRATVLFVDLRGYTGLAEKLPPVDVASLLDEFFGVLASAAERHDGQIFYMVGDGMMAGFGLRSSASVGAQNALAAAQGMLTGFAPIVERWQRELSIETGIGVGVHFGDVARCLHGPPGQRMHTLVGDTVNVAARLCSRARAGEVLFSAAVAAALQAERVADEKANELTPCIRLPQFALRGRSLPLDIWCMPAPQRLAL
ncbi:MAG: adenylate/guanylate cyclase domain-containing protein [Steroidobacteraceae bacterium]|jgi:adenylate cyclase